MLMLVVGLALAWWQDRRQLDARLQKLEKIYAPSPQTFWSTQDALGRPDDPTGMAGKSWCPSLPNGVDWLEVSFDRSVAAATIDLHETYSVGCVKEVFVLDGAGNETSIWKGTDPTPPAARTGVFSVPVPKTIKSVQRVKIVVDSVGQSPWPCIDAVSLTTANGQTTWATSASCSSVYGNNPLTASIQPSFWESFW